MRNGITPQDLKAYGINDAQDIVYNPTTIHCIKKSSILTWKVMNVVY